MTTQQPSTLEVPTSKNEPLQRTDAARRVAVIDLGSNSARVVVMRTVPGRVFFLEDEVREVVRLRQGMTEAGLSEPAMQRGLATLHLFSRFCESLEVDEIIATTTSAVREAANRDDFLARVEEQVGLPLRVLSGDEEAYYGAIGAQNAVGLDEGVVLDIGGGSAQLSLIREGRWQTGQALTLGALALSERFVHEDPPSKKTIATIREEVRRQLGTVPWLSEAPPTVVGLGGTLRNLARIAMRRRELPLNQVHGFALSKKELARQVKQFRKLPLTQRRDISGLSSDRADIILAGALVADEVLRHLEGQEILLSGYGLREGLFFEQFWHSHPYPVPSDLRTTHVRNLAERYSYQVKHAHHVQWLALRLFDQLTPLHDGGAREREWLAAAALLHDIGIAINYESHHVHSQALIMGNGLPAFRPDEVGMIALLTRYHRRGKPKLREFKPLFDKPAHSRKRLRLLAAMLRMAEFLERSRTGLVEDVVVEWDYRQITLRLVAAERPLVEMWDAERQGAELLEDVFGRTVRLEYADHTR